MLYSTFYEPKHRNSGLLLETRVQCPAALARTESLWPTWLKSKASGREGSSKASTPCAPSWDSAWLSQGAKRSRTNISTRCIQSTSGETLKL